MKFADHFSGHSAEYAAARPSYPASLFDYLAALCPRKKLAWDCATGSGQAAFGLSPHFEKVIATDASAQQIEHISGAVPNVFFHAAPAEDSGIEAGTIDLITVAQALHWFRFSDFYDEVNRVAGDEARIAVWCYGLTRVTPEIDDLIRAFYQGEINQYWPPERIHIETAYRDIPFPFEEITPSNFEMNLSWTATDMLAYLRTWSSVKRFEKDQGRDPVAELEKQLTKAWGNEIRRVNWPLNLKVGRMGREKHRTPSSSD